ncbi:hypothetical protein C8R42DRAFT_643074 [Lentinula raphanica]|nr:hypothetical protein C8R42DRAFT_643074 [Lentinula raphanica]
MSCNGNVEERVSSETTASVTVDRTTFKCELYKKWIGEYQKQSMQLKWVMDRTHNPMVEVVVGRENLFSQGSVNLAIRIIKMSVRCSNSTGKKTNGRVTVNSSWVACNVKFSIWYNLDFSRGITPFNKFEPQIIWNRRGIQLSKLQHKLGTHHYAENIQLHQTHILVQIDQSLQKLVQMETSNFVPQLESNEECYLTKCTTILVSGKFKFL